MQPTTALTAATIRNTTRQPSMPKGRCPPSDVARKPANPPARPHHTSATQHAAPAWLSRVKCHDTTDSASQQGIHCAAERFLHPSITAGHKQSAHQSVMHETLPFRRRARVRARGRAPMPLNRSSKPNARPRASGGYRSAIRLCVAGMTSARPRPLAPLQIIACGAAACAHHHYMSCTGGAEHAVMHILHHQHRACVVQDLSRAGVACALAVSRRSHEKQHA